MLYFRHLLPLGNYPMGLRFHVGDWLVEPDLNRIVRADNAVQIEPKVMDVLAFLASHPGEVCPKDKIIKAVWTETFVSDDVLAYSISELRKAFGDNARNPSVIATISKRGYRLIAPVTRLQEGVSRYEVLGELGRGGMGKILLAQDSELNRKVALKLLPDETEQDSACRERLIREARAAAALDHPYICKIYDTAEIVGKAFIAMEYLEGETLREKLADGPIAQQQAVRIACEVAEALEAAHQRGLVHRDLKPSNIMLTDHGHVKVMDFGLAKQVAAMPDQGGDEAAQTDIEATGTVSGTVPYMSPEQLLGAPVDGRSDIFSLGIMLYEMLSGVNPFLRDSPGSTATALAREDPPPLSLHAAGISEQLEPAVRKMLAKLPEERYQEMQQVRSDLEKLQTSGRGVPVRNGTGKWIAGLTAKTAAALLSIALLFTLLIWYLLPEKRSETMGIGITPAATATARSIAVIPFENLSPDPQNDFFADGFTEDLINQLSKIGHLQVMSRTAVAHYGGDAAIVQIEKDLGVHMILKGSIRREGDQVRISTQLIDAKTGKYVWAETYDRELTGIFRMQSDVARSVAAKLNIQLSATEQGRIQKQPTANLNAYDYYLKGREYYRRYRSRDNENAIALFEKALELDPNFALAHAALADCYAQKNYQFGFPAVWTGKAMEASRKALSIDPDLAEAHKALGFAHGNRGRLQEALKSYYRAVELNPNYSGPITNIAVVLEQQGKFVEALQWTKRSLSLNPVEPISNFNVGDIYWDLHDIDRAEEWYMRALSLDPDYEPARIAMSRLHIARKDYPGALKESQRILSLDSTSIGGLNAAGHAYLASGDLEKAEECYRRVLAIGPNREAAMHLSLILWKKGATGEAKQLSAPHVRAAQTNIDRGSESWRPWWVIAVVHAAQGDSKEAIPALEKAAGAGWRPGPGVWNDHHYENLLGNERFRNLTASLKEDVDQQRRRALLLAAPARRDR